MSSTYPNTGNPIQKTVLDRIADRFITRITDMVDEDGKRVWNQVYQGTIDQVPALAYPCVALQQGTEEVIHDLWPHHEKICTFFIEFRFQKLGGVDSFVTFRYYLGKLQARLFGVPDNVNLGGLTTNVFETGSNPEVEGQGDRAPGGLLSFNVHYRHWTGDPYHLPSETPNYAYGSL